MKRLFFLLLLVALLPLRVGAQAPYEYVVALTPDSRAYFPAGDSITSAFRPSIDLIAGPESAVITLSSNLKSDFSKTIQLQPFEHVNYEVWRELRLNGDTSQEVVSDHALQISSSSAISCLMLSTRTYQGSEEGFLLPERRACGTEYRCLNYYSDTLQKGENLGHSFVGDISIVSFENDTRVTIAPSSATATGRTKDNPLILTLQKGQSTRIYSVEDYAADLTSTIITSSRPVAIYSHHNSTVIPSYLLYGVRLGYHIAFREAIPPTNYWGQNYYLTNDSVNPSGYLARVLASKNNTSIYLNGEKWGTPLNENEFRDTLLLSNVFIIASEPSLVGFFPFSPGGVDTFSSYLSIVPPLEHLANDLSFMSFQDTILEFSTHFVSITTARSGKGKIRIDSELIPESNFFDIPFTANDVDLSCAVVRVKAGAHRVTSENPRSSGFVLMASGNGSHGLYQTRSYGYGVAGYHQPAKSSVTSISDQRFRELHVYPNPTNGSITIDYESKLSGVVTLSVYSVNGVLVHEEVLATDPSHKRIQLDASGWASGAYTIVLKSDDEEARGSVIKN